MGREAEKRRRRVLSGSRHDRCKTAPACISIGKLIAGCNKQNLLTGRQ